MRRFSPKRISIIEPISRCVGAPAVVGQGARAARACSRFAIWYPSTLERYWQSVLFFPVGVYILLALGLNIVVGETGLLDLGYVAFFAVGAYTTAKLTAEGGSFTAWEAVILAIAAAMTAGVLLGGPDPATARRLPRDRHPRLRRDRPDHRPEQRVASARPAASPASRTRRRSSGSTSAPSRCPTTTWCCRRSCSPSSSSVA